VFRTIGDQPSLWESMLPEEVLRLPEELARVDALLDDPVFFAPFAVYPENTHAWAVRDHLGDLSQQRCLADPSLTHNEDGRAAAFH
jgi:hypothetical protein